MDRYTFPHHMAMRRWLLILLLSMFSYPLESRGEILHDVCPEGRGVDANRTLEVDLSSYDGGMLGTWYSIARDFVNAVKPENLPYDVIEEAVEEGGYPCEVGTRPSDECLNATSSSFHIGETFSGFLNWWTPILAVACVGVAVGVAILVAGCVFWICRCCGSCGGGYSMKQSHDCLMFTSSLFLLLCVLGLVAGVVLTFYSNQQTFDSLDSIQDSVNRATDYGVEFAENLINDGIGLFCEVVDIVRISIVELHGLQVALGEIISRISTDVDRFFQVLEQSINAIEASGGSIERIVTSADQLDTRQQTLNNGLTNAARLATSLLEYCEASQTPNCQGLPHPSIFILTRNFSQLLPNNLTDVGAVVNSTLDQVDLSKEQEQGQSNYSKQVEMISQNITMHVDESMMELERLNETVIEGRDNITNSTREVISRNVGECADLSSLLASNDDSTVDINAGFIQHCIVDEAFESLHEYDLYRYGFGVAVASLSVIVILLVLLGMLLGIIGWRPKKQPSDRTSTSHCGGRFLLVAVGVAFLFGCLVMIMAAFGFFFGSNAQKVCQSLEGPDYEGFQNTLDNTELWGGSLLGAVVFDDPQKTLSLSQLLRNCEANHTLYKAMNLSFLLDIRSDIVNFTEVTERLSEEIFSAARSINLGSESFFSSSALKALQNLNRHFSSLNIKSLQEELSNSSSVLGYNSDDVVHNLTAYLNTTTNATIIDTVDQLISQITSVSDLASEVDASSRSLLEEVTTLQTAVTSTATLVELSTNITEYITGVGLDLILNSTSKDTFTRIAGLIDNFVLELIEGLNENIGGCRPLWGIYTDLHISVCHEAVDGLNGFWFSIGLCGVLFIPTIILSVLLSTCYMRQQNNKATYFMDDPYSDYLMDDSSKRNSSVSVRENNFYSHAAEDQV